MKSIYNYSFNELVEFLESIGEKKFRATQIFEWLYRFRVSSFEEMTNLSSKTIDKLKEHLVIDTLEVSEKEVSKDAKHSITLNFDTMNDCSDNIVMSKGGEVNFVRKE